MVALARDQFVPCLEKILNAFELKYKKALSAEVALQNMYVFGLITDISRKLKEYKDENNLMLLADAPKFLNGVIRDSDTPFIYEKVGSFYKNYLIDEFQDTSGLQWQNFQPLIVNSLDQGYPSLVVGDVKQAIYRWRGGDLSLLQEQIGNLIGKERVDIRELDKNFRSAPEIVQFNNALFQRASRLLIPGSDPSLSSLAYTDVEQVASKSDQGFVEVRFVSDVRTDDGQAEQSWKEIALDQLPLTMEKLQEIGADLKDIAILVRKNDEGQKIANYLLQYKNSSKARAGCSYDVVSNESLRIDGAASVNLLLGAMRYLLNTDDSIARAQLGYEFARLHEPERELSEVFAVSSQSIFENNLPAAFAKAKGALKKLPLIELSETLIDIFELGKVTGELVYLQTFQDIVLEFSSRERNDLGAFLEWWEANKKKKSIQISGEVNAAQILTIHKSKGLQFKYVIIPFCSWPLDHEQWQAPNLWVKSDQGIFAHAGYIPVRYSKTLEHSCFSEYYAEEHTRSYVDNLNLLYVAFTRAEQGLIVTAPHPSVRYAKNTVAGLIYDCIQTSDLLKDRWNEERQCWQSGDWFIPRSKSKGFSNALILPAYLSAAWREKLVIRQSAKTFFDESLSVSRDKINYGIHMHTVLSRLKYADEIDRTLEDIMFEGLVTMQEKKELKKQIDDLLSLPGVASWFSRDWTVLTEAPVLLPGGEENRLDRLIHHDKKAVVIDFKTGERKKTDNQQVLQYIQILRQMNFTDVEGFLLYLRDNEVVEVSAGRALVGRQKTDKDQLTLGF